MAVGKFGFKHLDDASKAAIRRYGDDMNPAFLIDEGTTYLKNTPIIKKADRLLDRSQQLVQDGWNKVANSPMGRGVIDAVPEGLKGELISARSGLKSLSQAVMNELPSTIAEDTITTIEKNRSQQEIGEKVGTFDDTFPDFKTLKKTGIDVLVEDDIWNWWNKIRK